MSPKQRAFLKALALAGNVQGAADRSEVGRRTVYDWLEKNPEFKAAFDDALDSYADLLEQRLDDMASAPGGRHSFLATIARLKALRPEKYRDNAKVEHTGAGGAPIALNIRFIDPPSNDNP